MQTMAIFEPNDRNYSDWTFIGGDVDTKRFHPIRDKLLVGDTVYPDKIEHTSRYRNMDAVPGILVYNGKTYGRHSRRMLYKCVPNDTRLPAFLVPYVEKETSFDKSKKNKFVLFKFVEWKDKHPLGMITNTLGEVSNLSVFYNYQLFCNDLQISIKKFTKATNTAIRDRKTTPTWLNKMEDRTAVNVITIDPQGSVDYDDALSIVKNKDGTQVVSVYISNVAAWLDKLDLWKDVSERVATVYLPDSKQTMLPTVLSDNLCSLIAGEKRYVVAMDVTVDQDFVIQSVDFANCVIKVRNNYLYEEVKLLENSQYRDICQAARSICNDGMYMDEIQDSHDVVAFFMLMMNHRAGMILARCNLGIFRGVSLINREKIEGVNNIPKCIQRTVSLWRNTKGHYETSSTHAGHDLIGKGLKVYSQVTSPIRRIVDLVNIIELQKIMMIVPETSSHMREFAKLWTDKVQYINESMKKISRVQNDCKLLERCLKIDGTRDYKGYVIDILPLDNVNIQLSNDNTQVIVVYIEELGLTTQTFSDNDVQLYSLHRFTMHLFEDESTLKRKVRVQIQKY
tara:strand:+ start:341 stop:2038 length:1698 start_codon:yes stop_codon:yes gene_type:complete